MKKLTLVLTFHWYDETASGRKRVEYRVISPRWLKIIWEEREKLTTVVFHRGMTSRTLNRIITRIDIGPCPIPGWEGDYIRIHFTECAEAAA